MAKRGMLIRSLVYCCVDGCVAFVGLGPAVGVVLEPESPRRPLLPLNCPPSRGNCPRDRRPSPAVLPACPAVGDALISPPAGRADAESWPVPPPVRPRPRPPRPPAI